MPRNDNDTFFVCCEVGSPYPPADISEIFPVIKPCSQCQLFTEFFHPLPNETSWRDNKYPPDCAAKKQRSQRDTGLDGLAESHLVTKQEGLRKIPCGLRHHPLLVRVKLQGVVISPQWLKNQPFPARKPRGS